MYILNCKAFIQILFYVDTFLLLNDDCYLSQIDILHDSCLYIFSDIWVLCGRVLILVSNLIGSCVKSERLSFNKFDFLTYFGSVSKICQTNLDLTETFVSSCLTERAELTHLKYIARSIVQNLCLILKGPATLTNLHIFNKCFMP